MTTRNVTPQPSGGGKPTRKQQTNTNAHISLVLQEVAAKLTRRLSEDEMATIWDAATKFDHEMTADEALAVLEVGVEELTGKRQRKVKPTAEKVTKDVAGLLKRELTPEEKLQISDSIADAEPLTRSEYEDHVSEVAGHYRNVEQEEAAEAQALADAANPPVERWTKEAIELGTTLGARIWSFAAMHDVVEKVNYNFAALKDAIDTGNLPPSARIMPDFPWKKTTKDGKHTTNEKGFLDFQDYCLVVLKRGKSAVYSMLKNAKMPREKKDPDNSLGAVIKRGAKTFTNLHEKLSDKDKAKVSFDSFMSSVVTAARAIKTAELAAKREEADQPAASTNSPVGHETIQGKVLPPSQGQAG